MEILYTIISGTFVYAIGQMINEFYIKPLIRFRETKNEIIYMLGYYASTYTNKCEKKDHDKASYTFRRLACEFSARTMFQNKKNNEIIYSHLIGLSNGTKTMYYYPKEAIQNCIPILNSERADEIKEILNLK